MCSINLPLIRDSGIPRRGQETVYRRGNPWICKGYEDNILETCTSYGDGVILYQTGSLQVIKDGPMVAYGRISYEEDDRKEKMRPTGQAKRQLSGAEKGRVT